MHDNARSATWRWVGIILLLVVGLPAGGRADDHLEVMYQKVIQASIQQENHPWRDFILRSILRVDPATLDLIHMAASQAEMRGFPLPGERWLRSIGHPKLVYRVKRTRIRSEQELHQAMTGGAGPLTRGQTALMTIYQTLSSEPITRLRPFAFRSKVQVVLTDLSVIEEDPYIDQTTYQGRPLRAIISFDFWPMAVGAIQFSSIYFLQSWRDAKGNYQYGLPSPAFIRSNTIHEYAHTLDRMLPRIFSPIKEIVQTGFVVDNILRFAKERSGCYGKDSAHFLNEVTTPLAASLEGWAIFHEMINSEEVAAEVRRQVERLAFERPGPVTYTFDGDYELVNWDDPRVTGPVALRVEGVQACILYRLAKETTADWRGVCQAFSLVNRNLRILRDVLRAFVHLFPDQAGPAIRIVDEETHGKLTVDELIDLFGHDPALLPLLAARGRPDPGPCPVDPAATPADPTRVDPRSSLQTGLEDILDLPTE